MTPSLNPRPSSDISSDTALQEQVAWYALRVRSRHEKKVAALLAGKGVEISLPLRQSSRQWSDRKKTIQEPLFRGYVFTRIPLQLKRYEVLQTPGAVAFAGIGSKVLAIPDQQMYWLDQLLTLDKDLRPEAEFPVGQQVRVIQGPWRGVEGTVQELRGTTRLIIWLDALMQGLSVNMDMALVEPLTKGNKAG